MATERTQVGLSPDGRRVTVTCVADDLDERWQWNLRLTSRALAVGVQVGWPELLDVVIEAAELHEVQRVTYRGHSLELLHNATGTAWSAALRSAHHSLLISGNLAQGSADADVLGAVVSLLDQLAIKDVPAGLTLHPRPGSGISLWGLVGAKMTSAGPITLFRRAEANGLLSTEPGLRVRHGEVWTKSVGTDKEAGRKFVHGSETAVCMLDDDLGQIDWVTKRGQEALLESLHVTWS